MTFVQAPPQLGNQYQDDDVLRGFLRRVLPMATLAAIENDLVTIGDYAAQAWALARQRSAIEPTLMTWDAWGQRVDRIELTPAWHDAKIIAARHGLVAAGHDSTHGEHARVHQFAMVYLFHNASEFYSCPLAMTDGAATVIKASANTYLIERALPHYFSRDPAQHWISGQWMTETSGGSDIGGTETSAHEIDAQWHLSGRKWFTSAVHANTALVLARPAGNADGADSLALFYIEPRDADGHWRGIEIDKLKHKLGTRELPTAEIHLHDAPAILVGEKRNGVRAVAPMLNVTRTWNAICALATMRRGIALARDYAQRRNVFGRALIEQPLHRDTLAGMQAEFEACFQLTFFLTELLGRVQANVGKPDEVLLLRLLTPIVKLWTGKQAVTIASEACECFGGAGYLEDSGIPQLLRDAQVFSIWEGTSNVLALDFLRALQAPESLRVLLDAQQRWLDASISDELADCAREARNTMIKNTDSIRESQQGSRENLEAGARRAAIGIARSLALALLIRHAAWALSVENDPRPAAAAQRFSAHGLANAGKDHSIDDAQLLTSRSPR
ncbi:acyl-CoA dehydrogenase [Pseudolysobacter antarcticus]|uniref:Acyl-CoA dehydrogenase n=1 Tax=Pseudolysobacter antarcticus TaxID=2511995 RepID=A0A411HM59_9GAMM|nr:acyl-CoA dehydrogenase family protein [Pseudolysobacter antarcticus]QBB71606.1 acyl-CoA dehydrogenase [Pseudolysobacter antarcticus]